VDLENSIKKVDGLIITPFSAIPSWEGYEYQGHIALYVVLKEIKKEIENSINIETSNFLLEIEGKEDFSIKDNAKVISLHQVKYGSFSLQDKDKFCFLISVLQYKAQNGYFHILPKYKLPNDFSEITCCKINELKKELSCPVISKKDSSADLDEKSYIIIENIAGNSEKGSKYNILKYALDSNGLIVNKENIEKIIAITLTELKSYEQQLFIENKPVDDNNFIFLFDDLFDNISSIKCSSYSLVKDILELMESDWKIGISKEDSINYPEFVYGQLLIYLKNKITSSHENKKTCCEIRFSEIFCQLKRNIRAELNSIAYQYYIVWKSIQESFDNYPIKTNSCSSKLCNECDDNNTCNLFINKNLIANINEDKIHSFLYKLMLKKPEIGKVNNLPSDQLIHRLLICLLKEIDSFTLEKDFLIQLQKEGQFYRLTLNSDGEPEELQEQLSKEIQSSVGDKLLLYETDVLVTDQLNEDVFRLDGISTMVLGKDEYAELEDITSDSIEKIKKNCNKPKILKLIDRKIAKEELG